MKYRIEDVFRSIRSKKSSATQSFMKRIHFGLELDGRYSEQLL